jgi:hypothetical protein
MPEPENVIGYLYNFQFIALFYLPNQIEGLTICNERLLHPVTTRYFEGLLDS